MSRIKNVLLFLQMVVDGIFAICLYYSWAYKQRVRIMVTFEETHYFNLNLNVSYFNLLKFFSCLNLKL